MEDGLFVELLNLKTNFILINVCLGKNGRGVCSVFQLTTAGRAANKPHFAAILSVDGEILCLSTRIFLIVTRRGVTKKERENSWQLSNLTHKFFSMYLFIYSSLHVSSISCSSSGETNLS